MNGNDEQIIDPVGVMGTRCEYSYIVYPDGTKKVLYPHPKRFWWALTDALEEAFSKCK